ncbi:MAG: SH3 domain-containing protein [Phascolarctobacterium sp.]|uniref:SH3 domain-containing protein n=1 Tax=Phascolarctobacterium sp. TaxID=2049039 RepID=UPI0026DB2866|nr:SH3 domain-containing protein [Phascolarctobacterium sp.]MDO4921982.1 SH3 domain-containing protein [Phascolarctobacterium sp.]
MLYKLLCTLLLAFCAVSMPLAGDAAGITQYPKLVEADYWTAQNKEGDKLILDAKGVQSFNAKVRAASRSVPDLLHYPATVSGDSLKTRIMDYLVLEDDLYLHGNKVSENYKNILRKQTNVGAVPATVTPRYAVTVRRSSLRNLPTGEGLFYYAAERNFDALQETSLDPGEPLLVLHQSANKYFYYVQSVNYSGWISTFNIAFTDKKTWQQYAEPEDFLVVTAANVSLKTSGEQVIYQQGARLPLVSEQSDTYTVEAPVRSKTGLLQKQRLLLPKSVGVHKGYLPYTSNNILRAAFAFYDMPYGWGGLKNSVDCSSLVFNAYRTVGIYLPRNADEQEEGAGTKKLLEALDDKQKTVAINGLRPGAALYMDGHVVLYLGQINGVPYVIHSLGSYFSGGQRHVAMKVVVSDLSLQRSTGDSFLMDLRTAVEFR